MNINPFLHPSRFSLFEGLWGKRLPCVMRDRCHDQERKGFANRGEYVPLPAHCRVFPSRVPRVGTWPFCPLMCLHSLPACLHASSPPPSPSPLGNTCYLNSSLQCLRGLLDIPEDTRSSLAQELRQLLLHGETRRLTTVKVLEPALGDRLPELREREQTDSGHFTNILLQTLFQSDKGLVAPFAHDKVALRWTCQVRAKKR